MSDQNFTIRLRNTRKHRINVYLEPWGEVYPLEPYTKRVDAVGPIGVPPNNSWKSNPAMMASRIGAGVDRE